MSELELKLRAEITQLRAQLEAAGKRPAPCENLCEARAFEIEIRKLKAQLEARGSAEPVALSKAELDRDLYRNCYNYYENVCERLVSEAERYVEALQLIACGEVMTGNYTHADTVLRYQDIARKAIESTSLLTAAPTPPSAEQPTIPAEWKELVKDFASDLESEVNGRYGNDIHPAMARKYKADMEIVLRAREMLSAADYENTKLQWHSYDVSRVEQPDNAEPESVNNAVLIKEIIRRVCSHVPSEDGADHIAIEIPVLRGILNDCIVAQSWANSHSGAAPQQEPAAWMNSHGEVTTNEIQVEYWRVGGYEILPLYLRKPQRITEQDAREIWVHGYEAGHNDGIGCGHSLAPR